MSLAVEELVLQRADGVRLPGPLSLTLAPGERLGLAGESGSGKSLLARALFGVAPPGVVQCGGALGAPGSLGALNPLLTLGEHLSLLPGLYRKESQAAALQRLGPLLERLRLPGDAPPFLARFPHQLSGGQRHRLCLAMALSCGPELLVLDEPTTALDPLVQRDFLELILDLQRERGLGFLWITHDLAVASQVCERLLVL